MTIVQPDTRVVKCDYLDCDFSLPFASKTTAVNFYTVTYETTGGGHYGLPMHEHEYHYCLKCADKIEEPRHALSYKKVQGLKTKRSF